MVIFIAGIAAGSLLTISAAALAYIYLLRRHGL